MPEQAIKLPAIVAAELKCFDYEVCSKLQVPYSKSKLFTSSFNVCKLHAEFFLIQLRLTVRIINN